MDKSTKSKSTWHWSFTVTLIGGLAGATVAISIWSFTEMPLLIFLLFVLGIGGIAAALQWKKFYSPAFIEKNGKMSLGLYFLYNIAGIGIGITAMIFLINWLGASSESVYEKYEVTGPDRDYVVDQGGALVLLYEDDAYKGDVNKRAFLSSHASKVSDYPYVVFEFKNGLLGFKLYEDRFLENEEGEQIHIGKF